MSTWSRSDILTLAGLLLAAISCIAGIAVHPRAALRRALYVFLVLTVVGATILIAREAALAAVQSTPPATVALSTPHPSTPLPITAPPPAAAKPLASKLLITGSNNEVYIYGASDSKVPKSSVIRDDGQHLHIDMPSAFIVDVEFTGGRGNSVWCRDPKMIGQIVGDRSRGNTFEVRDH